MALIHRLISTCLGIGYTPKGGGTIAAAVCCIAWYFAWVGGNELINIGTAQFGVTIVLFFIGVYCAGKVEPAWGKDSYRVVIDEVAGMALTLCFVPVKGQY